MLKTDYKNNYITNATHLSFPRTISNITDRTVSDTDNITDRVKFNGDKGGNCFEAANVMVFKGGNTF